MRYKETSIIVKIFTRELGLKPYLINGVRSAGGKSKMALYQPLSILDLVVYDKATSGLQRVSEAKLNRAHQRIPFDFARTGIALFLTEVISRSIYEEYQNEYLFDFLVQSIVHLDSDKVGLKHFPLVFLVEQLRFLGFAPEEALGFIEESKNQPFSPDELNIAKNYLVEVMKTSFEIHFKAPIGIRRKLVDYLLDFYSEQMESTATWKTLPILRQLLD